jgi:hypothetical protein
MLTSRINNIIRYPDTTQLDPQDVQYECDLYEMTLYGHNVVTALGQPHEQFVSRFNVRWWPIYLVDCNTYTHIAQIGVHEALASDDPPRGQLTPILNTYATKDLIRGSCTSSDAPVNGVIVPVAPTDEGVTAPIEETVKAKEGQDKGVIVPVEAQVEVPTKEAEAEEKEGVEAPTKEEWLTGTYIPQSQYATETEAVAKQIRRDYDANKSPSWVAKFMHNLNYHVDQNGVPTGGLQTLANAFMTVQMQMNVTEVQRQLAHQVTAQQFTELRNLYETTTAKIKDISAQSVRLSAEYEAIKARLLHELRSAEKQELRESAMSLKHRHEELKKAISGAKAKVARMPPLKGLTTAEEYREYIRSPKYVLDMPGLSLLERLLQIKVWLFRQSVYADGDMAHVIYSDTAIGTAIGTASSVRTAVEGTASAIATTTNGQLFRPKWSVLLAQDARGQYQVCTYMGQSVFKGTDIPYDLARIGTTMCVERQGGLLQLMNEYRYVPDPNLKRMDPVNPVTVDPNSANNSSCTLLLYPTATVHLLAGELNGEYIPPDLEAEYEELNQWPNWRRMLDDSWACPFGLEDRWWPTVDHYVTAKQYAQGHPEVLDLFSSATKEDMDNISLKEWEKVAAFNSPTGMHLKERVRPPEWRPDTNGLLAKDTYAQSAIRAKMTACPDLSPVLLATKKATLCRFVSKGEPVLCNSLMAIRAELLLQRSNSQPK